EQVRGVVLVQRDRAAVALALALPVDALGGALAGPPSGDDHLGLAELGVLVVEDDVVAAAADRLRVGVLRGSGDLRRHLLRLPALAAGEHPADEDPAQRDGPADDKGHRIHAPHRPSVSIATAHRTLSPNPAAARSRGPGFPERKTAGIGAGFLRWGGKSKSSQAIAWFFGRPSLGRGACAAQRERAGPARAARSASMSAGSG